MTVNGTTVTALGTEIAPETDRVTVDGRPVCPGTDFVYILMNKPPGILVSLEDPHHPRTVLDLLHGLERRVFPVGRLDLDTSGVLLLTDDGDLTFRLCHPRHGVFKTYLARVQGVPDGEALRALTEGVDLDGHRTAPARVQVERKDAEGALLRITVHEGRKRQIKRMCREVGHPVRALERVSFGGLTAAGLRPGAWRYLTPDEVTRLKQMVGLET